MKDYEKKDLVGRVKLFGKRTGLFIAGTALVYSFASLTGCGKPIPLTENDIRSMPGAVEIPQASISTNSLKMSNTFYLQDIDNDGGVDAVTFGARAYFIANGKNEMVQTRFKVDDDTLVMNSDMQEHA